VTPCGSEHNILYLNDFNSATENPCISGIRKASALRVEKRKKRLRIRTLLPVAQPLPRACLAPVKQNLDEGEFEHLSLARHSRLKDRKQFWRSSMAHPTRCIDDYIMSLGFMFQSTPVTGRSGTEGVMPLSRLIIPLKGEVYNRSWFSIND
jgi:hypothetical protein